jgi:SAM-dependent methyltransferase
VVVSRAPRQLLAGFRRVAHRLAGRMLDAGCGTGGFLARFWQACPSWRSFGLDVEPIAVALVRQKSAAATCGGSLNALPSTARPSTRSFFSSDVLCHRSVDESRAVGEIT